MFRVVSTAFYQFYFLFFTFSMFSLFVQQLSVHFIFMRCCPVFLTNKDDDDDDL